MMLGELAQRSFRGGCLDPAQPTLGEQVEDQCHGADDAELLPGRPGQQVPEPAKDHASRDRNPARTQSA